MHCFLNSHMFEILLNILTTETPQGRNSEPFKILKRNSQLNLSIFRENTKKNGHNCQLEIFSGHITGEVDGPLGGPHGGPLRTL